jgi:ribose 5-phosphate isomerase A
MTADGMKRAAAQAAVAQVPDGAVVGVGTGSTVNHFIDALASIRSRVRAAVSSSKASTERLAALDIPVVQLNSVTELPVYVDGADEIDHRLRMIKGGGGALTGEKIVAAVARRFICIADEGKLKERLGAFPLPVEVIPLARAYVEREMIGLGGRPQLRHAFVTDYGNLILDVHGLPLADPGEMEGRINQIAGVVTNGLFARRPADLLLLGTAAGVKSMTA